MHASENGHIEIVELLLQHGADAKAQASEALICASEKGHTEIMQLLLQHGADPKAQDSEALTYAELYGQTEATELLQDYMYPYSTTLTDTNNEEHKLKGIL